MKEKYIRKGEGIHEGWDFDGTIAYAPKGGLLKIYRVIEKFFPLITIFLPLIFKPSSKDIIIITASENKVGVISWLKFRKIDYKSLIFVKNFKEKEFFIKKLCDKYIEVE